MAQPLSRCRRDDCVRVNVFRERDLPGLEVLGVCPINCFIQIRHGSHPARVEVCDKARSHDCPVLISDGRTRCQIADRELRRREQRERGSEQEEADAAVAVMPDDSAQQGKRRVIENNAPVRVIHLRKVRIGPERSQNAVALDTVLIHRPVDHSVINERGRVAVIRCLLRFELVNERIIFGIVAEQRGLHPVIHCNPPSQPGTAHAGSASACRP